MPTRRTVLISLAAFALAPAARAAGSAEAFLEAIYRKLVSGGGTSGGQSMWVEPKDRVKWFSAALVKRWAEAETRAKSRGEEIGPVDFDPFTNSQDPQLKGFSLEKLDALPPVTKVRVRLKGPGYEGEGGELVFDLVDEKGWKIDDILGSTGGDRWSLKDILAMP